MAFNRSAGGKEFVPTFRNIALISYAPVDFIQSVLDKHKNQIRAYSYILHDKFSEFELAHSETGHKEIHTHILLRLFASAPLSRVENWFLYFDSNEKKVNTLAEGVLKKNIQILYEYQIHKNDPDKFQFSEDKRICSDESEFLLESLTNDDVALSALNDMLDNVPLKYIAQRYGRDFIYHYSHIKILYNDIINQNK